MKAQTNKSVKNVRLKLIEQIYEFNDSENLTRCVLMLYKTQNLKKLNSSIYKTDKGYRLLIISEKNCKSFVFAREFCNFYSISEIEISKTKEYGKPLIENNAIYIFGKAFNQET